MGEHDFDYHGALPPARFDVERHNRPPTLSEYATAKKEMEVAADPASKEGDTTVILLVDRETLLDIYWNSIPQDQKRKIVIGD